MTVTLFAINVLVDKVSNLTGWTIAIEYNPSLLELQSVKEGDALDTIRKKYFPFNKAKLITKVLLSLV